MKMLVGVNKYLKLMRIYLKKEFMIKLKTFQNKDKKIILCFQSIKKFYNNVLLYQKLKNKNQSV